MNSTVRVSQLGIVLEFLIADSTQRTFPKADRLTRRCPGMRLIAAVFISTCLSVSACGSSGTVDVRVGAESEPATSSGVETTTTSAAEPIPTTDRRDAWLSHPAAVYVATPDFLAEAGLDLRHVIVTKQGPADPADAFEGCAFDVPPEMDGLSAHYLNDSGVPDANITIGINEAELAQQSVDAARQIGGCDPKLLGGEAITVVAAPFESKADDVVILEGVRSDGRRSLIFVARYGDMMILVNFGVDGDSTADVPSAEAVVQWANELAGHG